LDILDTKNLESSVILPFLDLPMLEADGRFRTEPSAVGKERTFGGRLVCEAQLAASQTVDEGFHPYSTCIQFLRPGDATQPTFYSVEALKNGRSFSIRIVRATQGENLICLAIVSFSRERPAAGRQQTIPQVPAPESLPTDAALRISPAISDPNVRRYLWGRAHPIEFRHIDLLQSIRERRGSLRVWFRAAPGFLNRDDPMSRAALLAYASDRYVMMTPILPHLDEEQKRSYFTATLEHSLWIHRDFAPGSWLLHEINAVTDGGSLTFLRGEIFSENGDHIASVAQEGMLTIKTT